MIFLMPTFLALWHMALFIVPVLLVGDTIYTELVTRLRLDGSRETRKKIREARKEFEDTAKSAGTEFEKAGKKVQGSSKKMEWSIKGVTKVMKAFIALEVVRWAVKAGKALIDLATKADQLRVVETSFQRLAATIKQSSGDILSAMRRGLQGTVSSFEMMRQANQAILLGIPVTAAQMEEMSRVALRLGRAVNQGPVYALTSLVTGIGRQSALWLDNLGILVDTEKAYKDAAAALGKTTTQLSESEKRLAFFNTTMAAARKKAEELGDMAPSLGEKWAKVSARWEDVKVKAGQMLLPWLEHSLSLLNGIISAADAATGALNRMAQAQGKTPARPAGASVIPESALAPTNKLRFAAQPETQASRPLTQQEVAEAILNVASSGAESRTDLTRTQQEMRRFIRSRVKQMSSAPVEDVVPRVRGLQATPPKIAYAIDPAAMREAREMLERWDKIQNTPIEDMEAVKLPGREEMEVWSAEQHKFITKWRYEYQNNLEEAAEAGEDAFRDIPDAMQEGFDQSLSRIEAQMQALGLRNRNLFGGIANIRAGMMGLGIGDSGGELASSFMKGLSAAGFAGQVAAGAVGIIKGIGGFLGIGGPSTAEQLRGKTDAELRSLAQADLGDDFSGLKKKIQEGAVAELGQRQEAKQTQGEQTYGSTYVTLTEATGKQQLAELAAIGAEMREGHLKFIREDIAAMRTMMAEGGGSETLAKDRVSKTRSVGA